MARSLSVIGDRWTLMILRDCFLGVRRFETFAARLGLSRTLLADRLSQLVEAQVLRRVEYQTNPSRSEYRLTSKGLDLHPVILALVHWGDVHCADEAGAPVIHRHIDCGCDFHPVQTCSSCGGRVAPQSVEARKAF